jgi:hypothetical protein
MRSIQYPMAKEHRRASTESTALLEHVRREYHRPGNGVLKTEEEIAVALGEEARTIRTWRHAGVIPFVQLGYRTIRYRLADVIKAIEKRVVKEV